jgi:hypothetical protein
VQHVAYTKAKPELWGEVIQTTIHVLNQVGSKTHKGVTTYELWIGRKPSTGYFKTFGCMTYACMPKDLRKKFDPKSVKTIFVGYNSNFKVYNLRYPLKKQIIICRGVLFQEEDTPKHTTIILNMWSFFMSLYRMQNLMQPWN